MFALTVASISLLAILSYKFTKSPFHPAVLFCSFWATDLLFLWLAGDFFYRVHAQSLLIEVFGAFAFCAGSFLASWHKPKPDKPSDSSNKLITLGAWIVAFSIPVYVKWLINLVADRGMAQTFLMAVRQSTIEIQGTGLAANLFGLLVSFSMVLAMIAFRQKEGHRFRCYVAVVSAFLICFLTATKGGPIFLLAGLMYIHWRNTGKLSIKALTVTALVMLSVVAAIEFYVHVNGDSFSDSVMPVARSAALYVSGPIVAFDEITENPNIVPDFNAPYDVSKRIVNKFFGTHLQVSGKIPTFLTIGPFGLESNTYGFYAWWFTFGAVEAVAAAALFGFLLTLVFIRAQHCGAVSVILYASLVPGICLMPYMDYISSIWVNCFTAGMAWAVYYLPRKLSAWRDLVRWSVARDITASQKQLHN